MKLHRMTDELMTFHCPGCNTSHVVSVNPKGIEGGKYWSWNGSVDKPTLTPSILVTLPAGTRERALPEYLHTLPPDRCHSFVKDGRIQFLDDCSHSLKGQTVDLPEWDETDKTSV